MEHTKEAYAEYVMDGVDCLVNLQLAKLENNIEVKFIKPLSPLENAILSANAKTKFVNHISGSFRQYVEQCIVNNIVVIYASNPSIHMDDAIKIAFTYGVIAEFFPIEDLERAARKAIPSRGWRGGTV